MKNESPIDGIIAPANRVTFSSLASPRSSKFGFKVPILARSGGEIVDGHLRIKAAKRLGIQEVPVILCHEWTPEQVNKEKRNP